MLDMDLLSKYQLNATAVDTPDGCWTNFLGLHTKAGLFQNGGANLLGRYISEIPAPHDCAYGGAAEYASLLTAIDQRAENRSSFSAVEIGAGWGPWISAVGVTCKRLKFEQINLVGVEAESSKVRHMQEHMALNALRTTPVKSKLIRGAAWSDDTTLYFPKEMPTVDYGGAASTERSLEDYRGISYELEKIPAYSFETICSGLDIIDYTHWDVQGAEWPIASSAREFLDAKVRYLFVGTHSRKIEGDLIELFFSMGWDILLHDACHYEYDRGRKNLVAMTQTDGNMFFCNPKLL